MTICYFGDYNSEYSRTKIILKGLALHGVKVLHVNVRGKKGVGLFWELYQKHKELKEHYDVLFIGVGDSRLTPLLAHMIARAPVLWEPLFSIYDNWVFDRKLASPHSLKALWYWFIDWLDCKVSDLIILDTKANAEYFHHEFGVPMKKLNWIYIGADDETFIPQKVVSKNDVFEVEFHGKYIPVQGPEVIVRGAKALQEHGAHVHFTMIGSGQEGKRAQLLAHELQVKNITFLPFMPIEEVTKYVAAADVCIGLIGDVPRVARAIPNKLYEAAAMGKPSINADTPALRELFTPGNDVIAIPQGDHNALAAVIADLMQHPQKAKDIGTAARETYLKWGTNKEVGKQTLTALEGLVGRKIDCK